MASYDNKVLTGDQLVYFSGLVKSALANKADASVVSGKQDALEFNTAYNASSNKVATMADIPTVPPAPIVIQVGVAGQPTEAGSFYKIPLTITSNNMAEAYAQYQTYPSTVGIALDMSAMGLQTKLYMSCESFYRNGDDSGGYTYDTYGEFNDSTIAGEFGYPFSNVNIHISTGGSGSYGKITGVTTKSYVDNAITTALSGISSFSFEIVQSLPVADISTSKIYLVAKNTSGTNQVYTEYAYVNNAWEIIGDTSMTIETLSNAEVATIWNTASAT